MTSHIEDEAIRARSALIDALGEDRMSAIEAVRQTLASDDTLTLEAVKSAVWALARSGLIEVTWDGELVRAKAAV